MASDSTSNRSSASGDSEKSPAWMRRVPLITGALAALGGYLTVHGADLGNNANYWSSQAGLVQAQASDKWNEYEADSIKAHVDTTALAMLPPTAAGRPQLETEAARLRDRQPMLKQAADDLERKREDDLAQGQQRLREKDFSDYAGMAAQLGIALASVAALTRRPEWFTVAVIVGLGAVGLTIYSLAAHYHLFSLLHHR